MKKENRAHILFRYLLIIGGILLFAGYIIYKLFDTTIISADHWNKRAIEEFNRTVVIKPERGDILADNGSVLATNLTFYNVRIDYRCEKFQEGRYLLALDSLADSLARYFPVKNKYRPRRNKKEWLAYLKKPLENPRKQRPRSYPLLNNISYSDYLKLRTFPFLNIPNRNKNGLVKEEKMRRVNPYGDMALLSIGGVSEMANGEVHGWSGLECALDSLLYGKAGVAKKIPLTKDVVNWTDTPAVAGYTIKTTIDIGIQDIVENELSNVLEYVDAKWGVAVVMDVHTGDIKAISNLEKEENGSRYVEGVNRAVLGYEPGSVVKTLSMVIALEDGIVTDVNRMIETGHAYAYAGGRPITDSHWSSSMKISDVIVRSSNIGMTKVITSRYGENPGKFYTRLKDLGFLEPMNLGLLKEESPRIDSLPNNRRGRIALSRQCYGYATEIPPIYTLAVYNAIANDGIFVKPRLIQELIGADGDSLLPISYMGNGRICSESNARKMREMLTNVVWDEHGTGKLLRNDKVRIAGKTGTCYVVEGRGYGNKKRLAFCGFFPAENPKYSCIVLTCYPKRNRFGAASTSGTVLKNIALKMFSRGMLDNHSDYKADGISQSVPTLYASIDEECRDNVCSGLGLKSVKCFSTPESIDSGMPDVVGLGVREAISVLEQAGLEVNFKGSGYVRSQSPLAGTNVGRGTKAMLTLAE